MIDEPRKLTSPVEDTAERVRVSEGMAAFLKALQNPDQSLDKRGQGPKSVGEIMEEMGYPSKNESLTPD